jgi:hypothetical protein
MHHITITDQQTPFHIAIQLPEATINEAIDKAREALRLFPLNNYYICVTWQAKFKVKTVYSVLVDNGKLISLYDGRGQS